MTANASAVATGVGRIPRPLRLTTALVYGVAITLWAGAWTYASATEPTGRL